uniref:Uncharacterized protein n=1 Tax=Ananas comosus var. bracteatus TaxID=296719 RepID=A0A6V7P0U3_ANACO|nr:unnamed protein product [Ananas comosus var. bracteatus]
MGAEEGITRRPDVDEEWITEVEKKIDLAFTGSLQWPWQPKDETEPKICKFTLHQEISRPRLVTAGKFSRPVTVSIGPLHMRQKKITISNKGHFTLMPIIIPTNPTKKLLKLFRDDKTKVLDVVFDKDEIAPDLLILSNQIPFFAIEELFTELKSEKPLHEYALQFFETIHPRSARHCMDENSPPKFLHLLDLFHWSRVPRNKYIELTSSSPQQLDSIDGAQRTPNALGCRECAIIFGKEKPQQPDSINWARHTPKAMELRESATMFEKKTSGSSLDIAFRRRWFKRCIGVLDIPELHIRDYSSFIFHNLIAFEMQPSGRSRCTMAFSAFMRNLLQTEEDVKLLRRSGILASSSLTDSKLVYLFECLSKLTENHQMPSDLCAICHQVQSYHNHPVSRFCGSVNLQYFPNHW